MRVILIAFLSFAFISIGNPALAASTFKRADDKYVYIQADGHGNSRDAALKSAWSEAVSTAVGIFTTSKTTIANDDLQETLTAYSRGNIQNYSIISERNQGGNWFVEIEAAVEKELLIQSEKSSTQRALSPDRFAKISSGIKKSSDLASTIENYVIYKNPQDCLDYNFDVQNVNGQIYALHLIKINRQKFNDIIINSLSYLLDRIAESKFDARRTHGIKGAQETEALERQMQIPDDVSNATYQYNYTFEQKTGHHHGTSLLSATYLYGNTPYLSTGFIGKYPTRYKNYKPYKLAKRIISIAKDSNQFTSYVLNDQKYAAMIYKKIAHPIYNISFFTDIMVGNKSIRLNSAPYNVNFFAKSFYMRDYDSNSSLIKGQIYDEEEKIVSPMMCIHGNGEEGRCLSILVAHKLDIPENTLGQITGIRGGYELVDNK